MDCNREEAIRAKGIAEKKMETKDFAGARKFGLKAQQLYPDLENISRMLMVCEVHCSAEQKLFGGNEKDWYGILQIDQKADEQTIKRQYKKFALQLHPDKNKFSGAEAAFQLITEAQNVLLDREKRNMHDMKRRASVSKANVPYRPTMKASYFHNVRSNIPGMNPQNQQQQQPTFWTVCPFCHVRYQYYRASALHKSITCQGCKKQFVAYETNVQAPPTTVNQQAYPQQKCGFSKVEMKWQGNFTAEKPKSEPFQRSDPKAGGSSGIGSEKVNRKRDRKRVVEASESSDSESSIDSEEDVVVDMEGVHQGFYGEQPRRSSRSKQQVSYKENLSDDDDIPLSKRGKRSGSSCATEEQNEDAFKEEESKMNSQSEPLANTKGDEEKVKQKSASFEDSSKVQASTLFSVEEIEARKKISGTNGLFSKSSNIRESMMRNVARQGDDPNIISMEPEQNKSSPGNDADEVSNIEVPEPVFYNFDADKSLEKFEIGQIWALYSDEDGLPKYYGQIKKIDSKRSKLKILVAWLECSTLLGNALEWSDEEMPISCGRFEIRRRSVQEYDSTMSFSHLVKAVPVSRTEVDILPKRGEVWAVYKNWTPDISISGLAICDYDIVEVCEVNGLQRKVLVLGRVDGFNSVFKVEVKGGLAETMTIPGTELLRFSHCIPSFRLTEEKGGSLRGCWELDPAAFPVRYFSQH